MVFALIYVVQKMLVLHIEALGTASQAIITSRELKVIRQAYTKLTQLEASKKSQPKYSLALK